MKQPISNGHGTVHVSVQLLRTSPDEQISQSTPALLDNVATIKVLA